MNVNFEDVMESLNGIPCYNDSVGLTPMISIPWVKDVASRLQAAHDAEMKQLSKEEFHRGYESGVAASDAEQWQLDRERAKIIEAVRKVVPEGYFGSDEMLSEICRAIYSPVFGWTAEAGRYLCDRLIYLLGGKSTNKSAETSAKVVKNGEKYQLATYDVLGNERHKAVCKLRKLNSENFECKQFMGDLLSAIDPDWISKASMYDDATLNEYMRDRLIHLLGGDECNFSTPETPETVENRQKPTEKETIDAPIASITDELRKFATDPLLGYASQELHIERITTIADRIDQQFARCCELWERTATCSVQEVHDELEAECDKLIHDVKMWRDRAEDMRMECNELRRKLDAVRGIVDGS